KGFNEEIHNKMVEELGLGGATIPQEYDGAGLTKLDYTIATIELSRGDAGVGLSIGATLSLVADTIINFGTEEQKRKWLPVFVRGGKGAYGQTEPNAGSDVAAIKTKGIIEGEHIRITGEKIFITNGSIADVIILIMRTSPDRYNGLTMIIVDANEARKAGTLRHDPTPNKLGLHCSPTDNLIFEDCIVPFENILGAPGMGWLQANATLIGSRPMIAAQAVGLAEAARDCAVATILQREQFGKKIYQFQSVQHIIAKMLTDIEAARLLTYQAAIAVDTTPLFERENIMEITSYAKYFAAKIATDVALQAMILHGGMGYMKESRITAIWEDVPITHIYEGTDPIQLYVIARQFFKKHNVKI
ncbi:MAG: hypothetical protein A3G49_00920, partial [Candidatus Sungbacteria bacterium RIFCSPLOWO2_12_FULL_41_11]